MHGVHGVHGMHGVHRCTGCMGCTGAWVHVYQQISTAELLLLVFMFAKTQLPVLCKQICKEKKSKRVFPLNPFLFEMTFMSMFPNACNLLCANLLMKKLKSALLIC